MWGNRSKDTIGNSEDSIVKLLKSSKLACFCALQVPLIRVCMMLEDWVAACIRIISDVNDSSTHARCTYAVVSYFHGIHGR